MRIPIHGRRKSVREDEPTLPRFYFGARPRFVVGHDDIVAFATPVGEPCGGCTEKVADGDRGFADAVDVRTGLSAGVEHLECATYRTFGCCSLAFLRDFVEDCGYDFTVSFGGSFREQAGEALRLLNFMRAKSGKGPL